MSITRFITAYWNAEQSSKAVKLAGLEIGMRSYEKLEVCECDLDELYQGEYLDTGEELSFEELLGGGSYVVLKKIDQETCHQAYCHALAFVKVLHDVYAEGYEATWKSSPNDHPDDIAFAKSLDQQIKDREAICNGFLSTYEAIKQGMMKYHPQMDDVVDTCIRWSHTVLEFAKAVNDKAMHENVQIEIEFVTA